MSFKRSIGDLHVVSKFTFYTSVLVVVLFHEIIKLLNVFIELDKQQSTKV